MVARKWTTADIEFLRQNYGKISRSDIADALGFTESAVASKVSHLGLRLKPKAPAPVQQVREMKTSGMTIAAICEALALTRDQVSYCLYQAKPNHLAFKPHSRITWSREAVNTLITRVKEKTPARMIAWELGVTMNAVRIKAAHLGLSLPSGNRSYTQDDIDLAYQMKDAGFSVNQIAEKLDGPPISAHTVRRILSIESPSWGAS